jgi:hypothetical protein
MRRIAPHLALIIASIAGGTLGAAEVAAQQAPAAKPAPAAPQQPATAQPVAPTASPPQQQQEQQPAPVPQQQAAPPQQQSYPQQPYPAQPYPGQPYPGQPYPPQHQPYPQQPYQPQPGYSVPPYPPPPYALTPPSLVQQAPPPEPKWYGYQTLLLDGLGIVAGLATASMHETDGPDLGVFATVWYGVGAATAPAIHYAHGRMGVGLADLGIRLLAPGVVGLVGLFMSCTLTGDYDDGYCAEDGWSVGNTIGLGAAAAIDAFVLGYGGDDGAALAAPSWYGYQTLIVDALSYGAGAIAVATGWRTKSGREIHPALGMWVIGYSVSAIGAPIVHFAHGRIGKGFISLGARVVLAPIGALPGMLMYCAASDFEDDCESDGAQWGLLAGSLAVSLFDAFALAHDPRPASPQYGVNASIGPGSLGINGYF